MENIKFQKSKRKSQILISPLHTYLKEMQDVIQEQNIELNNIHEQKNRILKLFSYQNWGEYMAWIYQKLEQSGQIADDSLVNTNVPQKQYSTVKQTNEKQLENGKNNIEEINNSLSEIVEEPQMEQSFTKDAKHMENIQQLQSELLAVQNAKLRKQNINLKNKLIELRGIMYRNGFTNLGD